MKSETMTVEQIFQNRCQYCVPFYQRAYVWTLEDQWEQLWDDIREKADARLSNGKITPHFMGAIVLEPQPREGLRGVENYHIIDGQQRLTTLQYVLTAILLALHSTGNELLANTVSACLKNGNQETMLDPVIEIFKVWPTFRDRDNFRAAMTAIDLNELALASRRILHEKANSERSVWNIHQLWLRFGILHTSLRNGYLPLMNYRPHVKLKL
jgi:hypothetical protein